LQPTDEEVLVGTSRLVPFGGIAFVILVLVPKLAFGGGGPDTGSSAADVLSYYDGHTGREKVLVFIFGAAVPCLVLFGIGLASLAPGGAVWRRVLVAGATLTAGTMLISAAMRLALVEAVDYGVRGDAIRALNTFDSDAWVAWNGALGVMMIGAGAALLGGARLLPRWLAQSAIVLGVLLYVPPADFVALLLSIVWILVVSIVLGLRASPAVQPARVT
jgi:hypothetical protein